MPRSSVALAPKTKVAVDPKLEQRLVRYQTIAAEINELLESKKALQARILADAPHGYETDEWKVTPVHSVSASHVSKELLVKLGVSAKIITKATVAGTPYDFAKITNKAEAREQQAARKAERGDED